MKLRTASRKHLSFTSAKLVAKKQFIRRKKLRVEMPQVVPYGEHEALGAPHYRMSVRLGNAGHDFAPMVRMCVYFLQQWVRPNDEALEDTMYDGESMREFLGNALSRQDLPDVSTVLKFRCPLEGHAPTNKIFVQINAHLTDCRLLLRMGTMVDAIIVGAPPPAEKKDQARDRKTHQTKKRNRWHLGMKAHVGANAESELVHSLYATSGNANDVAHTFDVLRGQKTEVFVEADYIGVERCDKVAEDKRLTQCARASNGTWRPRAAGSRRCLRGNSPSQSRNWSTRGRRLFHEWGIRST